MRWIASLVAEAHRILMRGGVFMYPRDTKDPAKPGRLRLLYEANPMAMLIEQAGGARQHRPQPHPRRAARRRCTSASAWSSARKNEVERIERYHAEYEPGRDQPFSSPLFNERVAVQPSADLSRATARSHRGRTAMSAKHPIIAITGSSGAGTTSVTRTFEHIFRREGINAAIVEGDTFHRYDRDGDEARRWPRPRRRATSTSATSAPRRTCSPSSRRCSAATARPAPAASASTCTTPAEAAPYGQEPGTFTPWEDIARGHRPAVLRGPARRRRRPRRSTSRQHADLLIGVVPIINLEWIQKLHRDKAMRGYSHEAVVDTILRRMPDYVNYICPQFSHTHVNFQRVPIGRHVQPVHRARHPDAPTRASS